MTLQQHFRDSSRTTKVAVYLKRRMRIEQIWVRISRERFDEHFVGVIAIEKACPKIDFPGFAPPGAAIAPKNEGLFGGSAQIRRATWRNFPPGKQTPKMGTVTMCVRRVVLVFEPFLKLAVLANTIRPDLRTHPC